MTPQFPTPDHYLFNLITMTSAEAKRMWRRSIKEHFNCQCVYCGGTYELSELTLDHVHPKCNGGQDITSNVVSCCLECNQAKGSMEWQTFIRSSFGVDELRETQILNWINGK